MATSMPSPGPDQGGAPPAGGPPSPPPQGGGQQPPSQSGGGQADQMQQLLAQWFQAAKQMAASDPRLASGAEKVSQGIQEMQAALIKPAQSNSLAQQPSY